MKSLRIALMAAAAAALGIAFGTALAAAPAAPTANVAWSVPTAYGDGTALPASDIAFYTVSACEVNAPGTCLTAKVTAPATTLPNMALVCGQYDFTVTVTTTATAIYPNATSGPSNVVPYATQVSCSPNPPTGVTVSPGTSG